MTLREKINEALDGEDVLLADGFDEALVGFGRQFNSFLVAIYDRDKCIAVLTGQGMSDEEAEEYFEYNVQGAYVGERTPIFLNTI